MMKRATPVALALGFALLSNLAVVPGALASQPDKNSTYTNIQSEGKSNLPSKPAPAQSTGKANVPEQPVSFQVQPNTPNLLPQSPLQASATTRDMVVPAATVLTITMDRDLNSSKNKEGEPVTATVTEPVFLGPYLAVPKGATLSGVISLVNAHKDKDGRNPYIVVEFSSLKRAGDPDITPMHASLIAYKNGLRGQDYVWRLPEQGESKRSAIKGVVAGAAAGAAFNPIFGPIIGAGSSLIKSTVIDHFARGGDVRIKAKDPLPIAVDEDFTVAVDKLPTTASTPREAVQRKAENASPVEQDSAYQQPPLIPAANDGMLDDRIK